MKYLTLVLWLSSAALAQSFSGKPYLESGTPFLKSAYCQRYRCTGSSTHPHRPTPCSSVWWYYRATRAKWAE